MYQRYSTVKHMPSYEGTEVTSAYMLTRMDKPDK